LLARIYSFRVNITGVLKKLIACLKTPAVDLYYRQEFLRKRQTNNLAGLELASQQCVIRGLNDGVE
jgi:hypothetical protein